MSPPRAPEAAAGGQAALRLDPGLFLPALDVGSRQALFAALVDALTERGVALHRDALLQALLEREALGSSAVGLGLAIPHTRSMVVGATAMAFARLRRALPFGAADGVPVRVVLLIVAPYGPTGALYQPLLAAVAGAARDDAGRRRLLDVETFEGLDELTRRLLEPAPPEAPPR
jgi:mannitol/fructose-specific phosphotransferase system IIA component (Ntr-type)